MDFSNLIERFTSRKFIAAATFGAVAVLADVGVIDPGQTTEIVAHATPLAYIVVEGFLDFFARRD